MRFAVPGSRNPEAADPEPVVRAFPHIPLRPAGTAASNATRRPDQ